MKKINFSFKETCGVNQEKIQGALAHLEKEIERVKGISSYATDYAFAHVPYDQLMQEAVNGIVARKKKIQPTALVVIGIGGSNLGTRAVQEALYGTFYNLTHQETKIFYADTVDSDYIDDIVLLIEQLFEQQETVMINVVSKSGSTTETSANAELFLEILKNYYGQEWYHYVVITTDKDSALWNDAQQLQIDCLEIPAKVGGRYSVFTSVGLFPLSLIGINTRSLIAGAQQAHADCTQNGFANPAAVSAALLYHYYGQGLHIHNTFLFSVDLESVGKWYRQLMGESIGKEFNKAAERKPVGITPTVSIGSTDLHSVGQLYLGGPRDSFTTFVTVQENNSALVVPDRVALSSSAKLASKPLSVIMKAILDGTQAAYQENKRPFVTIELPEKSAYHIGYFLQMKMIEMVYLGFLLDVNPFDQPNVESYKRVTRKLLQ